MGRANAIASPQRQMDMVDTPRDSPSKVPLPPAAFCVPSPDSKRQPLSGSRSPPREQKSKSPAASKQQDGHRVVEAVGHVHARKPPLPRASSASSDKRRARSSSAQRSVERVGADTSRLVFRPATSRQGRRNVSGPSVSLSDGHLASDPSTARFFHRSISLPAQPLPEAGSSTQLINYNPKFPPSTLNAVEMLSKLRHNVLREKYFWYWFKKADRAHPFAVSFDSSVDLAYPVSGVLILPVALFDDEEPSQVQDFLYACKAGDLVVWLLLASRNDDCSVLRDADRKLRVVRKVIVRPSSAKVTLRDILLLDRFDASPNFPEGKPVASDVAVSFLLVECITEGFLSTRCVDEIVKLYLPTGEDESACSLLQRFISNFVVDLRSSVPGRFPWPSVLAESTKRSDSKRMPQYGTRTVCTEQGAFYHLPSLLS